MVILGKDVFNTIAPTAYIRDQFKDFSKYYGEYYEDSDGEEMYMGDFTGDDIFPEITEMFAFAGLDIEEHYAEFDKLDPMEVHVGYFDQFNQADKDKWMKRAEDVGHPEQVIFRLGWNRRTQSRYKWDDFDY